MPQVQFESRRVDHEKLREFGQNVFINAGLHPNDAFLLADSLVASNLRGIDSHGVARITHYLNRIEQGSVNPRPQLDCKRLGPSIAVVEGDNGLGQIVVNRATELVIQLAGESGSGWVTMKNSSHCGALAYYGLQIADAGMIGIVLTHSDSMVIPYGAQKPFCGTNPICITAPRNSEGAGNLDTGALCLDMSTSIVPWNTVMNAAIENVPLEPGWSVDSDGNDTTVAEKTAAVYPIGGYKGSGLGLMIDVLCTMLGNSPFGPHIPKMYGGDMSLNRKLGGLVGAIDIKQFAPAGQFFGSISQFIEQLGALPRKDPDQRVLYPGEPELLERDRRLREGIPVGIQVLQEFDRLADAFGLPRLHSKPPEPLST